MGLSKPEATLRTKEALLPSRWPGHRSRRPRRRNHDDGRSATSSDREIQVRGWTSCAPIRGEIELAAVRDHASKLPPLESMGTSRTFRAGTVTGHAGSSGISERRDHTVQRRSAPGRRITTRKRPENDRVVSISTQRIPTQDGLLRKGFRFSPSLPNAASRTQRVRGSSP